MRWPRKNDAESIQARREAIRGVVGDGPLAHDDESWSRAQEAHTGATVIPVSVGSSVVNTVNPTWSVSTSWPRAVAAAPLARSSLDRPPEPESVAIEPDTSINTSTLALLRTSPHSDRTSRSTSGPGGLSVMVTPSACT